MKENLELFLQLFAEAASSDTAQFTGETEAAAASQATGEEQAPAAGVQDRSSRFEAMIKGEFKQDFDSRVQEILQKRLSQSKNLMQTLAQKYGVDSADYAALTRAVAADGEAVPSQTPDPAQHQYEAWTAQAEETSRVYPSFALQQALQDSRFARLLQNGVDVKTAYEVLHHRELMTDAMAYAAQATQKSLAGRLTAAQGRPPENALQSPGGAVVGQNVSQMSPQDRAEIIRRVRKGEKIRF